MSYRPYIRKRKDGSEYRLWVVEYRFNRQRYTRYYENEEDAKAADAAHTLTRYQGKHPELPRRSKCVLFREWAEKQYEQHFSKKRSARWTNMVIHTHLVPHFGDLPINVITQTDVREYAAKRRQPGRSPRGRALKPPSEWTIVNELAVLSKLFTLAIPDYVDSNPVKPVLADVKANAPDNRRTATISAEQMHAVLENKRTPEHFKLAVIVSAETGARLNEVLTLCWSALDFDYQYPEGAQGRVTFEPTNTKNKRRLVLPMTPALRGVLLEARRRAKVRRVDATADRIILYDGKPVRSVRTAWRSACRRAGIVPGRAGLTFHDLRRSFATAAINGGAPAAVVQSYLGHQDSRTTERYIAGRDRLLAQSVGKLGLRTANGESPIQTPYFSGSSGK